jgi:hypothetical protein
MQGLAQWTHPMAAPGIRRWLMMGAGTVRCLVHVGFMIALTQPWAGIAELAVGAVLAVVLTLAADILDLCAWMWGVEVSRWVAPPGVSICPPPEWWLMATTWARAARGAAYFIVPASVIGLRDASSFLAVGAAIFLVGAGIQWFRSQPFPARPMRVDLAQKCITPYVVGGVILAVLAAW